VSAPEEPTRKDVQYFEMGGHRGVWLDGWKAVTKHTQNVPYDEDTWELYNVASDFSESHDLAAAEPDRLKGLVDRWWVEADKHGVLPLDDRLVELFAARYADHTPHPPSRRYVYKPPMAQLPAQVGATLGGRGWSMTAALTRAAGDNGVLFATGTANAGLSLFLEDDRLVLDYNAFGEHTVLVSSDVVPAGSVSVELRFVRASGEGDFEMLIDGAAVGACHVPLAMRIMSSIGHSVGNDHGSPVSPRYTDSNPFTGKLHELVIQLQAGRDKASDVAEMAAEMGRQ
jgi:arylsulfatase